jgi:transcriptional regulator with XRE-family HTH domain
MGDDTIDQGGISLGARLREYREQQGQSLRQIERRAGINSGYLSQLERGEVSQPTPSMLQRLAIAYELPVSTLMSWAGYTMKDPELTPQQARALSLLGPDASDEEVQAIDAVLKVLRKRRATFAAPSPLDRPLLPAEAKLIRDYAAALLREADAVGTFPTPLDDLMAVGKLVYAGEITLTPREHKSLLRRLGSALDRVLKDVQGLISFGSKEIWLADDLHPRKRRFVQAHEIGHHILPIHREIAYLDNWETMDSGLRDACEREANQAAIELLAQGDGLRKMADDSKFGRQLVEGLSGYAAISLQATARHLAEQSHRPVCTIIHYRGGATGKLMDPHVYPSASFEQRFRWAAGRLPTDEAKAALRQAAATYTSRELDTTDVKDRPVRLRCEAINTPYALIGLVAKDPGRLPSKAFLLGAR